jgi:TIR domain
LTRTTGVIVGSGHDRRHAIPLALVQQLLGKGFKARIVGDSSVVQIAVDTDANGRMARDSIKAPQTSPGGVGSAGAKGISQQETGCRLVELDSSSIAHGVLSNLKYAVIDFRGLGDRLSDVGSPLALQRAGVAVYPYRVFISYTHEDLALAKIMADTLKSVGLIPLWDQDIRPGLRFSDAIKNTIATAHLFMPLITEKSQYRPWVHQETGYAIGINVPVVPIALKSLPGEMIAELQAITVEPDLCDLARHLQEADLDQIVLCPPPPPFVGTQVAEAPEQRTEWLVQWANWLLDNGRHGRLRQRALFSSLSIPDKNVNDSIWDRYDGKPPRSPELRQLLREERIALERHARMQGCTLMLAPDIDFTPVGADVHRAQLETLIECVESLQRDRIEIVFSPRVDEGNVTIVGDWFVAHALIPRPGAHFRQSVFTSHAPTVLQWVTRFDQQVTEAKAGDSLTGAQRVESAFTRLRQRLGALPA